MEVGDSEKEEVGCALRSSRRKANVPFSDRSRPPPFLLFLPPTTRICRCIKSDVYTFCFYIYLWKIKPERKLSDFEFSMYIVTQLAYILWGVSFIFKIWD
ncbi:hypothetical protein P9597_26285 [Aneurinibacillus migulanus]|uniref:hypothetical protein n=1 Tax=Aneurinibacillus migulanus TaxID=47500 RepID=UPI002E248888|nr:hypothetical protein [Aneurinibacillus migulanus]